jgi:hypothetical protein
MGTSNNTRFRRFVLAERAGADMVRGGSPSQGWKTFFRNHAHAIAAIDLWVVPTLTFKRLFAFLVLRHGQR